MTTPIRSAIRTAVRTAPRPAAPRVLPVMGDFDCVVTDIIPPAPGKVHYIQRPGQDARRVGPSLSILVRAIAPEGTPGYLQTGAIITRLYLPDSCRIGLEQIRSAFPELALLENRDALIRLLSHTRDFIGRTVRVRWEMQADSTENYNVRLLSSLKDLDETVATSLVDRLLIPETTTEEAVAQVLAKAHAQFAQEKSDA